jgi:hypothetical protein
MIENETKRILQRRQKLYAGDKIRENCVKTRLNT